MDNLSTTDTHSEDEIPPARDKSDRAIAIALTVLVLSLAALVALGYRKGWAWVGVGGSPTGDPKTLWDWLELLLVPGILAIGAYLLSRSESNRQQRLARQQRYSERWLAERNSDTDREIARDKRESASLDAYFDRMTDLLIDHHLRESKPGDEVRVVARTRTLSVLGTVDGRRRGQAIQFLYEAGLIIGSDPTVDLSDADLGELDMPYANLVGVNLSRTNLRKANLYMAKLMQSDFHRADLDGANLSWADLRQARLQSGLRGANLGCAKMDGAVLFRANLSGATLVNASLVGADLRYANLLYSNKGLGGIRADNVRPANLALAKMAGCDLSHAVVDEAQLLGVSSLEGATMPDGQDFSTWRLARGRAGEDPSPE